MMARGTVLFLMMALISGLILCAWAPAWAEAPEHVRVARQLRQDVLTLANNPHEPGALLLRVGRDPGKITAAVSAGIAWQPELGVVRGPAGTLSAGAAGDWDLAVLLQTVLELAGYPTRLVVAERSALERQQIVARFLEAGGRDAGTLPGGEPEDVGLLERYGVPLLYHEMLVASAKARWRRLLDEAYDAGLRIGDHLAARLDAPDMGPPVVFDVPAWQARLEAAARDAVAVEAHTENGWIMLKPGPDGKDIDWDRARRTLAAPAEMIAWLKLGVAMNVAGKDGSNTPVTLLEHSAELGDLFRRPIRLEIAADAGDGVQAGPESWSSQEWYKRVKGFQRYQAILQVGPEMFASPVFDMAGQVHQVGRDGRIEGATRVGGGIQRGFGGLFAAPGETDPEPVMRLESIVLTMEVRRPVLGTEKRQRLLYGPLRPGVTPVLQADLLAAAGPVSSASVLWLSLDASTANAGMWARAVSAATPADYPRGLPTRMPEMLHEWLLARQDLAHRQLTGNPDLVMVPGPAVTIRASQLVLDDAGGRVLSRTALDVVWDDLYLGPRTPAGAPAAQRANVSLGVACTAFEALLLRERNPSGTIRTAVADTEMALALGAGRPGAGRPSPLAAWGIEHNEAGRAVFFTDSEDVSTWWSVHPQTGAAVGRGDGGEGQAATEYGNLQRQNLKNLKCFLQALGGASGGDYIACVTGTDNKLSAAVGLRSQFVGFKGQGQLFGILSKAISIIKGHEELTKLTGAGT